MSVASGYRSFIANGVFNTASGIASAIVGGTNHFAIGNNSVVIGGSAITGSSNDTVYIPNARLAEMPGSVIYSAGTDLYQIFGAGGSGTQKYALSTGFTANVPKYIDHNLGLTSSTDALVQIWSGNSMTLGADISAVTVNQIAVTVGITGTYKIVVIG